MLIKPKYALTGATILTLGLSAIGVQAQSPGAQVKQAADQAVKTVAKVVKKTQQSGKSTGRKASATVGRVARVTAATTRKMLATPGWDTLRAAYDYDASAPDVKEEPVDNEKMMIVKLSFTGPGGKPVVGLFLRPKADGTYPCALLPHGLTNNKEIAIRMFGNALVENGIAILALDAPEHGAGQSPNKNYWTKNVITIAVHEGDRNYRRALDYLATRPDVDMKHIGLLGYSLGSIMGSILGAVDERVGAFAFCVGGDPFIPIAHATPDDKTRQAILQVCPSLFIPHLKGRPLIMFNGLTDVVVVPPAAKILQLAAPEPKQIVWYNGGHDVPQAIRTRAVDWLTKHLKGGPPPEAKDKPGADKKDTPPKEAEKHDP